MSTSNFTSCPPVTQLPDFLSLPAIPTNISAGLVPARDGTYTAMVSCCSPNPVHLIEGCYYWCELPAAYAGGNGWSSCLRANNAFNAANGSSISAIHLAGANNVAAGTGRAVLWAVAVTALLHVVSM